MVTSSSVIGSKERSSLKLHKQEMTIMHDARPYKIAKAGRRKKLAHETRPNLLPQRREVGKF